MNYSNKSLLLLAMLFLIVSISAVSAQDLNENSTVDLINDDDLISIENNDIADSSISDSSVVSASYDEEVLEASPDTVVPAFPEIDSGVVSGGVDLPSVNPGRTTSGTLEYTIPSSTVNIKSAFVIVNIYSGSGSNSYGLYSNVTFNSNNGIEVLGYETLTTGIESMVNDPNVYYISEHATKQYSDYQLLYPITDKVNNLNPGDTFTIGVANKKIDGYNFEGFIKTITLFVAYDDGDEDKISYWLDVGQLWTQTTETYSFSTNGYSGKKDNITLRQISLTSSDASYLVNNNDLTPSSIVSGDYYYKYLTFDNIDTAFTSGSDTNVLIQQPHGGAYGSYKTNIALLVASDIQGTSNSIFVDYGSGSDSNDGSSWADSFKTIGHALSIANEGATIYIASGVNRLDDVGVEGLTIDKNISIVGVGSDVIIDAAGAGRIFNIDGLTVNLNNLIFANADVSDASVKRGGALYVSNSILNIDNCKFINNTAGTSGSYSGAINLKASNATITNSYFENNTAWYGGSAVYSESGNIFVNIENSQFINNRALTTGWAMGGALMIYGDSIINRSVLLNNSLGDKSRANAGQAINYGQGNHILTNSVILGEGLLTVNLGSNAVASLDDNWWGNTNIDKDTNPKDLGYTNGNVNDYIYLDVSSDVSEILIDRIATINVALISTAGNEVNIPDVTATISSTIGTLSKTDLTLNADESVIYTGSQLGEALITLNAYDKEATLSLTVSEPVLRDTLYVDYENGNNQNSGLNWDNALKTIEAALDLIEADGTIYLADGTIYLDDSTSSNGITIDKNVKIIGESLNTVISGNDQKRIFNILDGQTLVLRNVTLDRGKGGNGGAIMINGQNSGLDIADSVITNTNSAMGAIYAAYCTINGMNNVTFINNKASGTGAALEVAAGTSVTIGDNNKFINSTGTGRGGAVHTGSNTKLIVGNNNLFMNNVALGNYGYGGALFMGNGGTIGTGNVFINNRATNYGGAISVMGRKTVTGSYCIFINNSVTGANGQVMGSNQVLTATFENCYWGSNNPNFSTMVPSNAKFTHNSYLVLDIVSNETSVVTGNQALITVSLIKNQNGQNIDTSLLPNIPITFTSVNGNVDPANTEIVNGIATTEFTATVFGEGSVTADIYGVTSTVDLNILNEPGTVFVNVTGDDNNDGSDWENAVRTIGHALDIVGEGKVIYIAEGKYYLDNAGAEGLTIDKNISIYGVGGDVIIDATGAGRIFNIDGLTVSLNNLIFANADVSDASVKRGGALYVSNSILNIDNCKFINNTAGTSGSYSGAINLKASNATITNSYFENNTAWYGGSAVYSESGNIFVNIENSQFINNRALNTGYAMGGALMLYGDSIINRTVILNNSLGDKSRANAGQAINYGQGNHILVNSIILGEGLLKINLGNNAIATLEDNWWGNTNIDKDTNPKDLGYTNGNVESYLVLSSVLSQDIVYLGDAVTITTTLDKNVIELPVEILADLGTVTPNETTMTSSLISTYSATTLGEEVVTIDVLGIKNEIGFTVKETLPDVAITNVKTPWSDGIYPAVNNTFTITLNNAEDGSVEGLVLEVYSNETGALIASYSIESLVSGTSTIYVTDPTIRPITEDTVWPVAQNNKIKFTFNLMKGTDLVTTLSVDKILAYNGYLNKTYAYGGHDNIINRNYTITGDIIIATQDESVYMDQFSRFRNETWNIETPEDADNIKAFLYFNYNWDTSFFPNGWTLKFNDFDITPDYLTHEIDRGNLGGWGAYDYGLLVFDVSDYYMANEENYFVIEKTGNCALYPSTLFVLYDMPNSHVTKEVYFSDICDVFYPNYNKEGYDDKIKFVVDYNGLNLENITEATWYVFTGSSSMNNNLLFNGKEIENAFTGRTSNSCYALEVDVTDSISENNRAWFVSTTSSSTTVGYEQVLVITKVKTVETSLEITSIQGNGTISGILKDNNGLGMANQNIILNVDGAEFGNAVTNENGEFTITGKNGVNNIIFEGNTIFLASSKSITLRDVASEEESNKTISNLEEQLEEAQTNATNLANELAEAKANLTDAEEKIADLENDLNEANQKIDNLTSQLANITAQLDNKTSEVANLTAQLADAQANATSLAAELAEAKSNLTVADAKIAALEAQLSDAQQQVDDLTAQLTEANQKIDNLTSQLANATAQLDNKTSEVANLTAQLADAQANATSLAAQLADAQANATSLAAELAEAKSNLTVADAKIAALEAQLSDAQQQVDDLTAQLADAKNNVTKLTEELASVSAQLAEAKNNVTKLTEQLANVTAQLAEAQKQIEDLSSDIIPTTIVVNDLKIKALNTGNFQVTLKDNKGNALANKKVSIIINGVTKEVTTDNNGVAKLSVKYSKAGTYNAVVTYLGDKIYSAAVATGKITVVKKATKITAPKKKFKVKKKTKKVKITLKSEGKALAKKKVTLKVKGKTYKAKTNKKGVATIKVKLNKKGTFKYTVKFAGDGTYKAISKKGKIVVKK